MDDIDAKEKSKIVYKIRKNKSGIDQQEKCRQLKPRIKGTLRMIK